MRKYLILAIASLLLASCGVYHPQMVDVPLISHKGDAHAEINLSTASFNYSVAAINLSASCGLNDWLAGQASLSTDFCNNNYGSLSLGAYRAWNKFVGEVYIGYGTGEALDLCYNGTVHDEEYFDYMPYYFNGYKHRWAEHEDAIAGTYHQTFMQVDGGWVSLLDGHLDIGLGIRIGAMHTDFTEYGDIVYGTTTSNGATYYSTHPEHKIYDGTHAFCERQLMVRIGGEHLKVVHRIGFTSIAARYDYSPISVSLGINYRF